MKDIIFSTSNSDKFEIGQMTCAPAGIHLIQKSVEIDEIQSEESENIVRDKADKAFSLLGQPLVVSDDSWHIVGLGGFPGPYMKSMNHWFQPEDFLRLTASLEDRRIVLVQLLAYKDAKQTKVFRQEYTCELLKEARGIQGAASEKVITMPGDKGLSISQVYDAGTNHNTRDAAGCWRSFITWYEAANL